MIGKKLGLFDYFNCFDERKLLDTEELLVFWKLLMLFLRLLRLDGFFILFGI